MRDFLRTYVCLVVGILVTVSHSQTDGVVLIGLPYFICRTHAGLCGWLYQTTNL